MDDEKIIDKIKKCLALAESSNPNEAETALRQARKLMDAHNIHLAEVNAAKAGEFKRDSKFRSDAVPLWAGWLSYECGNAFGCDVVQTWGNHCWQFSFIGVGSAPDLASYAFEILERQLQKARREYVTSLKSCSPKTKRERSEQFARGWIRAVHALVKEFAGCDEETQAAIGKYKAKHYPNLKFARERKTRKSDSSHIAAFEAGQKSGEDARLFRPIGQTNQEKIINQ